MKVAIIDKTGKKTGDIEVETVRDIRDDIFKKAVFAENSLFRQEKGADPQAGKKHSISLSKRRKNFRTTYGKGQARTPKKTMWARGRQMRFVGAFAPNTVGGRKAHAPKAQKILLKDVNNKEWLTALKVGFTCAFTPEIISSNGQIVPKTYPFVLDDSFEKVSKTKEMEEALLKLELSSEMQRAQQRTIRAGRGTMRGRTYNNKRGPIFVVSSYEAPLIKAARNFKGFDVVTSDMLMVSDFGMSEKPGRMVIFTKSALENFKEVFN